MTPSFKVARLNSLNESRKRQQNFGFMCRKVYLCTGSMCQKV